MKLQKIKSNCALGKKLTNAEYESRWRRNKNIEKIYPQSKISAEQKANHGLKQKLLLWGLPHFIGKYSKLHQKIYIFNMILLH